MPFQTFPVPPSCRPLLTAISLVHACTLLVFGSRFLSRWLTKNRLGWDDLFTTVAILASTIAFALFVVVVQSGFGYLLDSDEFQVNRTFNLKMYIAVECLYPISIVCARLAALLLYLRVFTESRKFRIATMIFMALLTLVVVVISIAELVSLLMQMVMTYTAATIASCAAAMLSNFIVLFLPMPLIFNSKMRISKRLGLHLLCLFSLSTVCVALWKLILAFSLNNDEGVSNYLPRQMFLQILETDLVILCTGIPLIYSIFTRHRSDRFENGMVDSSDSFANVGSYTRLLDAASAPAGSVQNQGIRSR